jgi:antitoxin MazE
MSSVIKTRIVKIGNSQGIRIPKLFLAQSNLGEEVEVEVQEQQIIIRPAIRARQGWDEQFREMAKQKDDQLIDGELTNLSAWDDQEWQW